jgi:hypothetical protein
MPNPDWFPGVEARAYVAQTLTALVPALEVLRHTPGLPADIAADLPGAAATLERFAVWLQSADAGRPAR